MKSKLMIKFIICRMFEESNNTMATILASMPTNILSSLISVCLYGTLSDLRMGIFELIYFFIWMIPKI